MVEQEAEKIAEFSDRVVILEDGVVALEGTPRDVFSQIEVMQRIGLAIPQVSELAFKLNQRWNTTYNFIDLEEAYNALAANLRSPGKGKLGRE